jgi:hypothetical protein
MGEEIVDNRYSLKTLKSLMLELRKLTRIRDAANLELSNFCNENSLYVTDLGRDSYRLDPHILYECLSRHIVKAAMLESD